MNQVNNQKLSGLGTPGGRFISGSLTEKNAKDYDGNNIPSDQQAYYMAVAVDKGRPGLSELLGAIKNHAETSYAQVPLVLNNIKLGVGSQGFSWKIEDGDVPRKDEKTGEDKPIPDYCQNKVIFKFTSLYDIGCCDINGNNIDPSEIKKGDYVDVMFTIQANGRVDGNAGLKSYANAVRFLGHGEAIGGSKPANEQFANKAVDIPEGAQQSPISPNEQQAGMGVQQAAGGPLMASGTANQAQTQQTQQAGMTQQAQQGMATTSPTNDPAQAGVNPHIGILGTGGGIPSA